MKKVKGLSTQKNQLIDTDHTVWRLPEGKEREQGGWKRYRGDGDGRRCDVGSEHTRRYTGDGL